MGQMFLVLIDAHAKWMDVLVSSATSQSTVENEENLCHVGVARDVGHRHVYTSSKFADFIKRNGI